MSWNHNASAYSKGLCRCDICKAAVAAQARRIRKAQRERRSTCLHEKWNSLSAARHICANCGKSKTINPKRIVQTHMERFMAYVEKQPNGCWHWIGTLSPAGYGVFFMPHPSRRSKNWVASRASCILHGIEIPPKMDVDHTCHKPSECAGGIGCFHRRCVNPDHLEPSTRKNNCSPERSRTGQNRAGRCKKCDVANRVIYDLLRLLEFTVTRNSVLLPDFVA